jgi:hypothetical protein
LDFELDLHFLEFLHILLMFLLGQPVLLLIGLGNLLSFGLSFSCFLLEGFCLFGSLCSLLFGLLYFIDFRCDLLFVTQFLFMSFLVFSGALNCSE